LHLLKRKYQTKKAVAEKMAKLTKRDPFHHYQYFSRRTSKPANVTIHFYRTFYKVFKAELDAIKAKIGIAQKKELADSKDVNFAILIQCVDKITVNMEKIVAVQKEILGRLDGRSPLQ
jgi:hypothetical protein